MAERDAVAVAAFAYEMGVLKRMRRSGWWHAGVRDPESVAEHSLRVSQIAAIIATMEGANPERAAFLAMWHDSQETRTGDLPHSARSYINGPDPESITKDQIADLPAPIADVVANAVAEFEARESAEASCARDADKLECLLQAVEYKDAGYARTDGWIESSLQAIQTSSAKRIAEAALTTSPVAWRGR